MGNLAFRLQHLFAITNKISKLVSRQRRKLSILAVRVVVTRWCKLKVRVWVEIHTKSFSAIIFILVLLCLMDFSDIV